MRFSFLIGIVFLLVYSVSGYAQQLEDYAISFRSQNELFNVNYGNNIRTMSDIKQIISRNKDVILTGNGHICLVAPIGHDGENNPNLMNLAALRAVAIRNYLKQNFRMLTDWSFTFYYDNSREYNNTIEVSYLPYNIPINISSTIHSVGKGSNLSKIEQSLSKYVKIPYLSDAPLLENDTTARSIFDRINTLATNPVDVEPRPGSHLSEKTLIAIHYRWDKYYIDTLYLSNAENLYLLDSILSSSNSKYIDTLTIVASASPEGQPLYNKRLSERRAQTIRRYILNKYKTILPDRVVTEARGENWSGLRNFVINDINLPSRDEVLAIIDSPLGSEDKQSKIMELNDGVTYYRYILPNYYRYLRNGASVLIAYSPYMPPPPLFALAPEAVPLPKIKVKPMPPPVIEQNPKPIVSYPVAFKSNLLLDAIGALNIAVEVPIRNNFSVVGDFAYSYWRTPKNLHAFQTLQYGLEGRYWFGVSDRKKTKNKEWDKPLRGWNVALYGILCTRYDAQWNDGYQGDGFWSAGVAGGYALPVSRNLTFEFSLGLGYIYTPEYRHYHRPEYDANGKYHLMWQETGSFGVFSVTKASVSLVWLLRNEKKGGRK